jgi:AAA domain
VANVTRKQRPLYRDELLAAPTEVKLQFFKDSIIEHDQFKATVEQIGDIVKSGLQGTMVVLVGPAGVGKSSIGDEICNTINQTFFKLNPEDKHTIPAALVEAWAAEGDRFDWHDFYEMLLFALQAPLITASLPEVKRVIAGREVWLPLIACHSRPTLRTLRQRLRRAVSMRTPSLLFVDEASNVLVSPRHVRVKRQANTLRSIVNKVNTRLVLSGAYDLYDLVLESGQLARRGEVIHFRPYLKSEDESFAKALLAMQDCMPVKGGCDLMKYADDLARQSLRTVGHLKYILLRALTYSYNKKKPIDEEILAHAFYKPAQLQRMKTDMYDGYWRVEQCQHPDDERDLKLINGVQEVSHDQPKKAGRKEHVGKTKPDRKAIG